MLKIVVFNLGFFLVAGIPVLAVKIMESAGIESTAFEMIITGVGIMFCTIYLAAVSYTIRPISDYSVVGVTDLFKNIKYSWKAGVVMGLCLFFLFIVITIILPFYMHMESALGLPLAAIVFWATIFGMMSFQFYFSVYARLGGKAGKSLKKCLLIAMDNTGFSLFIFIHNMIVLILPFTVSVTLLVFIILIPGPAGILLYLDEAVRLRILKYDWLEANPDANRRKIPWEELLVEEREKTGHRSFRNFIFPWKD